MTSHPLSVLRHHITGAIARGERPIVAVPLPVPSCIAERSEEDLARCYLDWMNNYISTDGFADAYGFPLSGCWLAKIGLPGEPAHAVRSFGPDQKDWALSVVRALPFEWSALALRVHPEYAEPTVTA